ncbi:type VII secretion integral membrane protein EccD [Frankia sp. AiPa1]|uniref:type VII secretion integral membrane protein EccD n=1 Tax=Frankia sp. AiPa1 TaxID=573492 RepID=UPI00202B3634|nr:type VII secretion integral membrane protein EccD [Frankia sp. AiPa1]MCL9762481.1 type VII secretion integral membrane protein EccD [Frankia sp. AiPa1]
MAGSNATEVCRLLVVGPTSRVDLSVPTHVPLADLMPAMLRSLGPDLADRGLEHSGWVVQRLGEAPLDEDLCVADHELLDGDAVHLRPRSDQIPPLDFDDLIDGVATGMRARSGRWRPRTNRIAAAVVLAVLLLGALAMPVLSTLGGTWHDGLARAAGAALLVVGAALAVGLILRDRLVGGLLGAAAVAFAVETALLALADTASATQLLAVGTGVGVMVALPLLAALAQRRIALAGGVGVLAAGLVVAVACGLNVLAGLDATRTAAVIALVGVAARPLVPMVAFKLAGMSLPPLPVEPDELQDDIEPEPGPQVLERTATADRFMTSLYGAGGTALAAAQARLAASPGWQPAALVVLVALAAVLAARPMTSGWHRMALGLPALAGLLGLLLAITVRAGGPGAAGAALAVTLLLALAAAVSAHVLPRRRMTPMWGRVGDWAHVVTLVLAVPLVVALLGGIGLVRSRIG